MLLPCVKYASCLDEMTSMIGTKKFDLMQYFDADDLQIFKKAFLRAMDEYLDEYNKTCVKVNKYNTFDELYESFMKKIIGGNLS